MHIGATFYTKHDNALNETLHLCMCFICIMVLYNGICNVFLNYHFFDPNTFDSKSSNASLFFSLSLRWSNLFWSSSVGALVPEVDSSLEVEADFLLHCSSGEPSPWGLSLSSSGSLSWVTKLLGADCWSSSLLEAFRDPLETCWSAVCSLVSPYKRNSTYLE